MGLALLSTVIWTGTAQVDVMIWEPGGEHPYRTEYKLEYGEGAHAALSSSRGRAIGYAIPLVPLRVEIDVHHEVRGLLNCTGGGHEVIAGAPSGEIVLSSQNQESTEPVKDEGLPEGRPVGFRVPAAGAYQFVLPWALGAFGCGRKKNSQDRRVVVGTRVFYAGGDIDASDGNLRLLEGAGSRMKGSFDYSEALQRGVVRHDYHVQWDLRRSAIEP